MFDVLLAVTVCTKLTQYIVNNWFTVSPAIADYVIYDGLYAGSRVSLCHILCNKSACNIENDELMTSTVKPHRYKCSVLGF